MLPDATKHPVLGAWCKREGIGSMILVPIFRNREVAGAMEFLFLEKRLFSSGDVMDLGLIAGVISGSLSGVSNTGIKQPEGPGSRHEPEAAEDVEAQPEHFRNQKANPSGALPSPFKDTIDDAMFLEKSSTPEPIIPGSRLPKSPGAPLRFWLHLQESLGRALASPFFKPFNQPGLGSNRPRDGLFHLTGQRSGLYWCSGFDLLYGQSCQPRRLAYSPSPKFADPPVKQDPLQRPPP